MQKAKLVRQISTEFKITRKQASQIVSNFIQQIKDGLLKERVVYLRGLGTFRSALKPRRIYRDIRTREEIFRPAEYNIQFKPAPTLRNSLKR
jgi:nucleoid DNA-binding protein